MPLKEQVAEYRIFFDQHGYLPWKAAEHLIEIAEELLKASDAAVQ